MEVFSTIFGRVVSTLKRWKLQSWMFLKLVLVPSIYKQNYKVNIQRRLLWLPIYDMKLILGAFNFHLRNEDMYIRTIAKIAPKIFWNHF